MQIQYNTMRAANYETTRWMIDFFKGEDVFIIGGGPSLHGFDFDRLKGRRVIAVNHSYMYTDCDVLVFLDNKFRDEFLGRGHNWEDIPKILAGPCSGLKTGGNISLVYYSAEPSHDPCKLYGNTSSTLVAINFALIAKAKNIYLMGVDCKFSDVGGHFYTEEWKGRGWKHSGDGDVDKYTRQIVKFNAFSKYKNIINLSPDSALNCFAKMDVSEVL